ncbi:MAG: hypothetical protein ACK55I_40525, partial [bacterium]
MATDGAGRPPAAFLLGRGQCAPATPRLSFLFYRAPPGGGPPAPPGGGPPAPPGGGPPAPPGGGPPAPPGGGPPAPPG